MRHPIPVPIPVASRPVPYTSKTEVRCGPREKSRRLGFALSTVNNTNLSMGMCPETLRIQVCFFRAWARSKVTSLTAVASQNRVDDKPLNPVREETKPFKRIEHVQKSAGLSSPWQKYLRAKNPCSQPRRFNNLKRSTFGISTLDTGC